MKRVIFVHGWDGKPEDGWFRSVMKELESKGFAVSAPQLPNPAEPHMETWVRALSAAIGAPDHDLYLVGHSMGCQTIARYLAGLPRGVQIGGVVYVAGYFKRLTGLETPEEEELWASWAAVPLDLQKIRAHAPKSVAIFSDNDPFVPMDNIDDFRDALGSEIIVQPGMGHFTGDEGCKELPAVGDAVARLAQS